MGSPLTIDSTTLRSLGFIVSEMPRFRSAPPQTYSTVPIYGKAGSVVGQRRIAHREGALVGVLTRATPTLAETALDQLKHLFAGGVTLKDTSVVGTVRHIDVLLHGELASPPAGSRSFRLNVPLLAVDPYWRAASTTTVTLTVNGTSYPTALGSAPSYPVIHLVAPTNPVITYRDSAGATLKTMTFTITLTGSDTLDINMATGQITKTVSAVTTNAIDALTSGDFPFALDPNDGVYGTSSPDIKTSSGGGASSTVIYTKAYL